MKIYLGGNIHNASDKECNDWRRFMKVKYREHTFLDPMDTDLRGYEVAKHREIVEKDIRLILQADLLFCYMNWISVGSVMEILIAWLCGIPVIACVPKEYTDHPWLHYFCALVTDDFIDARWLIVTTHRYHTRPLRQWMFKRLFHALFTVRKAAIR